MDTLFFRQPRLVMQALLVILSAGASALWSIGRQEVPTITNIFAKITTVFPGADPARVEALVTAKIETELRTIPEIATVSSTSARRRFLTKGPLASLSVGLEKRISVPGGKGMRRPGSMPTVSAVSGRGLKGAKDA